MCMQRTFVFFLVAMFTVVLGCEETLQVDDLPYEELLVIRGVLQAGDTVRTLHIGRTLPYQEYYYGIANPASEEPAGWVKDAEVHIVCEDKDFALHYTNEGSYANDSLIVETGKKYFLTVEWNGKKSEACTLIPNEPTIDTAYISSATFVSRYPLRNFYGADTIIESYKYTVKGSFHHSNNRVFGVTLAEEYESEFDPSKTFIGSLDYKVYRTEVLSGSVNYEAEAVRSSNPLFIVTVQSFDEPYFEYYNTGEKEVTLRAGSYAPVAWNVTGDGIGMFIGASRSVSRQFK